MARILHGMSIDTLPEPGEINSDDQIVAYRQSDGKAYRTSVDSIEAESLDVLDRVYPVGSIYMSVSQIDPATLFGGQWTQIEDCFLLAAGANHGGGETGGAETVTLTTTQIPSHTHSIPSLTGTAASAGSHSHQVPVREAFEVAAGSTYRHVYNDGTTYIYTNSAGAHTHTVTTNSSTTGSNGSGSSHNNMPPYLAVYVWQRIA